MKYKIYIENTKLRLSWVNGPKMSLNISSDTVRSQGWEDGTD